MPCGTVGYFETSVIFRREILSLFNVNTLRGRINFFGFQRHGPSIICCLLMILQSSDCRRIIYLLYAVKWTVAYFSCRIDGLLSSPDRRPQLLIIIHHYSTHKLIRSSGICSLGMVVSVFDFDFVVLLVHNMSTITLHYWLWIVSKACRALGVWLTLLPHCPNCPKTF